MIRLTTGRSALLGGILLAAVQTATAQAQPPKIPDYLAAAVADPARPAADVAHDVNRKPAQTLLFAGIKPGLTVAELLPGGGYYTRLLSKAVGSTGHVYALVPSPRTDAPDFAARVRAIAADPHYSNVSVVIEPFAELKTPVPVDLVWTSQNYHDLHNLPGFNLTVFNQMVFDALKPGGTYFILDHSALPGAGISVTSTLHRIDPATVKQEVLAAGFQFVGSSNLLHRPSDPRTERVFDPAIRGRTDQFILKFRKPAKP